MILVLYKNKRPHTFVHIQNTKYYNQVVQIFSKRPFFMWCLLSRLIHLKEAPIQR